MELYGTHSKSIPQKIVIHLIEIFLLWLSYWILFQGGANAVAARLNIRNATEGIDRRWIIFVFNIITFAIYFIGYALLVLPTSKPLDGIDVFAIALFVGGGVTNTAGEILRDKWKKNPENKGKLYTRGFFKYSRHINYFGDTLWVTAYAIATRNWYATVIPVFIFCFFAFYNAPKLDSYLSMKYGKEYADYARKTKMLIPFIY